MGVLSAVLGGQADGVLGDHLTFQKGRLAGYRVNRVRDEDYPLLVPNAEGQATGLVVRGLKDSEIARIRFFEETFYEPEELSVITDDGEAKCYVFISQDTGEDSGESWSFADWDAKSRRVLALAAEFFMARHGNATFEEADGEWELYIARAEEIVRSENKSVKAR